MNHNHKPQPFGRRMPQGQCPRCDELHAGAPAKQGWGARRALEDALYQAARRAHFAPGGPHARGVCGPVCTFGDW